MINTHKLHTPSIPYNRLTNAQVERLGLVAEEMGESLQEIGKILRHGYFSSNPSVPSNTNLENLEVELGDVLAAIDLLAAAGDVSGKRVSSHKSAKLSKLSNGQAYLHHQGYLKAAIQSERGALPCQTQPAV